jgi:hypothetical protein
MNSLTTEQQAEIDALKALPDDQIDTSDAPDLIALASQAAEDKRRGRLIPGGFGGPGEIIDELRLALETVNKAIALGVAERWQHLLASRIYHSLAEVTLWHDDYEDED